MPLQIIRNDITKVKADVIVNTANPEAAVGKGVDSAVYEAAGYDELLRARAEIGRIMPGEAKATPAFGLDAKYIIHTVGPAWLGGDCGEAETVAKCYRNSLELAEELGAESIALPLISTGTLGFPKDLALNTAISEISKFLFTSDMNVLLVVYNRKAFELSGKLFGDVRSYIEESQVVIRSEAACGAPAERRKGHDISGTIKSILSNAPFIGRNEDTMLPDEGDFEAELSSIPEEEDVDEFLKKRGETFQQHLFRLIDRKGLSDVEVYKRANLDRKHYSKIKSNEYYTPTKKTALAFAISLELNLDETADLLKSAGYAFSKASISDLIIMYFIEREEYDINLINCCLFDHGQQTLGA